MGLDDRAHQAADGLRRRVEGQLDLTSARSNVAAGSSARAAQRSRTAMVAGVVAVVALVGGLAVIAGTSGNGTDDLSTDDGQTATRDAEAARILGAMPGTATDGKDSYKLPVIAQPQSDLADGDTVTMYGKGFAPNEGLGIVQCSSEADTANIGIAGCQLASTASSEPVTLTPEQRQAIDDYLAQLPEGATWDSTSQPPPPPPDVAAAGPDGEPIDVTSIENHAQVWQAYEQAYQAWTDAGGVEQDTFGAVTYADADSNGEVVADFIVHRYITTPDGGEIDCQSAAERCLVGVGAISNYDQSGGSYIGFAGAPPFPESSLGIDPAGDPAGTFAPGQAVTAQVDGWVSGRQVRISQCIGDRCQKLVDDKADDAGSASITLTLQPTIVDDESGEQVPCEDQCVLRAVGIGVEGASAAPMPAGVVLRFTSPEPSAPVTTAPAVTTVPVPDTTAPPKVPVDPCPAAANCDPDPGTPADPDGQVSPGNGTATTAPVPSTAVAGGS